MHSVFPNAQFPLVAELAIVICGISGGIGGRAFALCGFGDGQCVGHVGSIIKRAGAVNTLLNVFLISSLERPCHEISEANGYIMLFFLLS